MTLIKKWSGNGLSVGALTTSTVGAGDTAFTGVTGTVQVEASGNRSPQIRVGNTAEIKRFGWWLNGTTYSTYTLRFYFSQDANLAASTYLFNGLLAGAGSWSVRVQPSGALRFRDDQTATELYTSSPLLTSTQYRIELVVTNGQARLYAFQGESETAAIDSGAISIPTALDEVRFGSSLSVDTTGWRFDDIAWSDEALLIGAVDPDDSEPEPQPTILKSWSGATLSNGTLTTSSTGTGDTPFTSVEGNVTIISGGLRSPQIKLGDAAEIKRFGWWPLSTAALSTYAIRFYVTLSELPSAEIYLANALNAGGGVWSVRVTSSGYLRLRDDSAATVRWTASQPLPVGIPIRIELVGNGTTAVLNAYRSDYDILLFSGSGTIAQGIDEARFGFSSSVASVNIRYDDMAVSSTALEIGPAGSPPDPHTHFRLIGGTWVPQVVSIL